MRERPGWSLPYAGTTPATASYGALPSPYLSSDVYSSNARTPLVPTTSHSSLGLEPLSRRPPPPPLCPRLRDTFAPPPEPCRMAPQHQHLHRVTISTPPPSPHPCPTTLHNYSISVNRRQNPSFAAVPPNRMAGTTSRVFLHRYPPLAAHWRAFLGITV